MANRWFFHRERVLQKLYDAEERTLEQIADIIVAKAKAKAPVRKIFQESKRRRSRAANPETIAAAVRYIQNSKRLSQRQRTEALYLLQHYPQEARVAVRRHNAANRNTPFKIGRYRSVSLKKKGKVIATEQVFRGRGRTAGTVPINRIERNVRPKRGFEPGPALDAQLSSRGRYELRSGRALTSETGEPVKAGDQPTKVQIGGRLKNSIVQGAITRKGSRVTVEIAATAPYALFVEFPTRHNAAQPFLLPALKEAKQSLAPTLENELRARGLKG